MAHVRLPQSPADAFLTTFQAQVCLARVTMPAGRTPLDLQTRVAVPRETLIPPFIHTIAGIRQDHLPTSTYVVFPATTPLVSNHTTAHWDDRRRRALRQSRPTIFRRFVRQLHVRFEQTPTIGLTGGCVHTMRRKRYLPLLPLPAYASIITCLG